jgi:hypothetical protein
MHTESMLLVDHHQTEILEHDVFLEERMAADENIYAALLERVDDLGALATALAAREHGDA